MLSDKQYELLSSAKREPLEIKYPLPDEWQDLKDYIYVVETYPLHCTTGVKLIPWKWAPNVSGLEEMELYEKARDNHADESAKERAQRRAHKAFPLIREITVGVIAGLILFFIQQLFATS